MDSLTLSATTSATSFSGIQFFSQPKKSSRILNFPFRKPGKYLVFASKDESKLDEWDQMELKFGRMIGEDPKITLTKVPSLSPCIFDSSDLVSVRILLYNVEE